jgi:hypothetical protein
MPVKAVTITPVAKTIPVAFRFMVASLLRFFAHARFIAATTTRRRVGVLRRDVSTGHSVGAPHMIVMKARRDPGALGPLPNTAAHLRLRGAAR